MNPTAAAIRSPKDIAEAYRLALTIGDSGACLYLSHVAKAAKVAADQAWNETTRLRVKGHDLGASYENGKAVALCEILGDQEWLSQMGVFD